MAMAERSFDQHWSQPLDGLLAALESSQEGLSSAQAQGRLQQFGPNVLKAREKAIPFPVERDSGVYAAAAFTGAVGHHRGLCHRVGGGKEDFLQESSRS